MHPIHQLSSTLDRFRPGAPLVLRVVIGGLFVWHGIDKFDAGIAMVEGMFRSWGVPAAGLAAPLTAVLEIAAGVALVAGLMARAAAFTLALVMVGSLIYVKADLGIIATGPMPGAELDLALLAGLAAVAITGPGRISVDDQLGIEPAHAERPAEPALLRESR
jgi:putative oxidoreductase